MTMSLRIIAVLLGLFGVERIIYADVFVVVPRMMEPTPALSMAVGLAILAAAVGLFLGYGWARWPAVAGATFIAVQGLSYVALSFHEALGPGLVIGLIEPALGAVIVYRLVRDWPPGVAWNARLR